MANTPAQRPAVGPFRAGRICAALTAVAALLMAGLTLLVGMADELPFVLGWFADATRLLLAMGAVATVGNLLVGTLVWRSERAAAQREGRASRSWPLIAFTALAVPLVVYVVTVIITQDALVLLIGLLLVCVSAALLLLPVSRLFRA